jgi:Zn-dependent M28 family amino/carboxypeptidase
MFNADMIGYKQPGTKPTIALMGRNADVDLNEIAKTATLTYLKGDLAVGYTQACCSDQQAFFENGFPAAGFFETPTSSVVYPQYHKSDDLLDKLDLEQIKLQGSATMASAMVFAGPASTKFAAITTTTPTLKAVGAAKPSDGSRSVIKASDATTKASGKSSPAGAVVGVLAAIAGVVALGAVAMKMKKRPGSQDSAGEPITPYGLSSTHDNLASL